VTAAFGAVALAALAGTPHCMGMCGALAIAGGSGRDWPFYHLGRIGTYAVLGALAGGFGAAIPGPPWLATSVSAVLLVGFAASLVGWVPEPRVAIPGLARAGAWFTRRKGPLARLGFGVVNGLLPCGLLYATLALPVSSGSAAVGAAMMMLFGAITAIPLTAASWGLRKVLNGPRVRYLLAALVFLGGLYSLAGRGDWFAPAADAPVSH
jgi:sulfite exporter TauE/SafE